MPTIEAATLPPRQHPTCSLTIFEPFFRRCALRLEKLDCNDEEERSLLSRAPTGFTLSLHLREGRALLSGYCSTPAFEDSHQTKVLDTNGRDFSFSSARLQKKTVTWRFSQIFGVGLKKHARKMSYECLDTRKCCHA